MSNHDFDKTAALSSFIHKSTILNCVEAEVSDILKLPITFSENFVTVYQERLSFVKLQKTEDVEEWLRKNTAFVKAFVIAWYRGSKENKRSFLPAGITIGFLCWALAFEQGGFQRLTECVKYHAFTRDVEATKMAKSFEVAYLEAKQGGRL